MAEDTQVTVVGATLSNRMLKKIEELVPVSEVNSTFWCGGDWPSHSAPQKDLQVDHWLLEKNHSDTVCRFLCILKPTSKERKSEFKSGAHTTLKQAWESTAADGDMVFPPLFIERQESLLQVLAPDSAPRGAEVLQSQAGGQGRYTVYRAYRNSVKIEAQMCYACCGQG